MKASLGRTWLILGAVAACSSSGQQLGVHEDASGGKSTGSGGKAQAGAGGAVNATGGTQNNAGAGGVDANGGTINNAGRGGTATGGFPWGGRGSICIGTIDEVNAVWGHCNSLNTIACDPTIERWGHCPATYCEAKAWVIKLCSEGRPLQGHEDRCGELTQVEVIPGLYGVGCGYRANRLVSNIAYDDVYRFCGNTAHLTQSAEWSESCSDRVTTYCSRPNYFSGSAGAGNTAGAAGAPAIPDANCYNNVTSNCLPCCPLSPPNCSDKPDGYPGYRCTRASDVSGGAAGSPSAGGDCDCDCRAGQWKCDCSGN